MATSVRQFNVELYQEHLEEASFLYEQRLTYLNDPEVDWPDIGMWEDRLEAHIDALVVGGAPAVDVCCDRACGDAGAAHAALRVLCRQDEKDAAFAILRAVDAEDEAIRRAVAEALCREAPARWLSGLLAALEQDSQLTGIVAHVFGYRRLPCEDGLRSRLAEKPASGRAELAWALGRVGSAGSVASLWPLVDDDDERVCEAAAIALMRLGDDRILDHAIVAAETRAWARRVLGMGGDSTCLPVLVHTLGMNPSDADAALAVGLLGDLRAVPVLVDLLDDESAALPAAVALNTITGAGRQARVFIPDEFDPDELTDEERSAYDNEGTLPTRNATPYGNWERRPACDKAGWRDWLDQNRHRFSREHRWRMGRPVGPAALFECLECATSPLAVRRATCEEFVIRYGLDVPFEVDLPVWQQWRFLEKIKQWSARQASRFAEGRPYFGGRIQA